MTGEPPWDGPVEARRPIATPGRRRWALLASWSLVLLVLLTLRTGAPFTLLEPLSVEQGLALALYLATSAFWIPRWRKRGVVYAHLIVVGLVLGCHPLTTALGRDGAFVVTALHLALLASWLTAWKAERKLLVIAFLVGLAMVETILSSIGEGPRSSRDGLADYGELMGPYGEGGFLLPDLNQKVVGPHGPVEFVTNSGGFRNRDEVDDARPADRRRVIIVGDSFVAGYRTDQERTVGRRLEIRLRERWGRHRVEVLVAGAGHPAAARQWLGRHGLGFDPDLVVLAVTLGNDAAQTWLATRELPVRLLDSLLVPADACPEDELGLLPVRLDRTLRSWRFYRRARRLLTPEVISSWFRDFPTRVHLFDPGHSLGLFYTRREHPLVEDALAALVAELAETNAECASRQASLLVAFIPQRFQLGARVWRATTFDYGLDPAAFDYEFLNRRLMDGCAAHELTCIDLLAGFQAAAASPLYQPLGDMHWNDAGHDLAADIIARAVEARLLSLAPERLAP